MRLVYVWINGMKGRPWKICVRSREAKIKSWNKKGNGETENFNIFHALLNIIKIINERHFNTQKL